MRRCILHISISASARPPCTGVGRAHYACRAVGSRVQTTATSRLSTCRRRYHGGVPLPAGTLMNLTLVGVPVRHGKYARCDVTARGRMTPHTPWRSALAVLLVLALVGCATPRPILYPNAHLQQVGQEAAKRDIAECEQMAKDAGASPGSGKAG